MRYILFCLFALIFVGCGPNHSWKKSNINADVELVKEARIKVARKLKQDKQLVLSGVGSQMMDQIKMIAMSFNYYGSVDEGKGRELLLAATDELVSAVNEDERIRSYLHNYPFGPKNVEIRIFLYGVDGSNPPAKELSVVSSIEGILTYKIDDPKDPLFTVALQETYAEAVKKMGKFQ